MPEIDFGGNELYSDERLAVALSLHRNHSRFCFAIAVLIDQLQHLSHHYDAIELHHRAVLAHAAGLRVYAKLFAFIRLAMHGKGHGQIHSQSSPTLFTAKMK